MILGKQEPWVNLSTHKVYPGYLAHHFADVNQLELDYVVLYRSATSIELKFCEFLVNRPF